MVIDENKSLRTSRANGIAVSAEQIKFYEDNGFLIVPDVFNEAICQKMKTLAATIADEDYSVILNIHRKIELFLEIMKDPILVAMVKAVQKHRVVGLNDQYLFKKGGTPYAKQSWSPHQDNAYVRAKNGTYIQLHIFLDQSERESGGLYYYPGSHREEILPYDYVKSWKEEFDENGISHPGWTIKKIAPRYQRIDVVGPKGGICLQHGNVIHGSYPNFMRDRSREQYSIAYLNEGEPFFEGHTSIKVPVPLE